MFSSEQIEQIIEVAHGFLIHQSAPVTERDLLIELDQHQIWSGLGKSSAIIRQFQKHFLTMHALYRLQERIDDEQTHLEISPDWIFIRDLTDPEATSAEQEDGHAAARGEMDETDKVLRKYYLDLNQLKVYNGTISTTPDDYKRRYTSSQQNKDAYATLNLNADASWMAVQSAYRQKAVQCHPDKGGNAQEFQRVQDAYQDLKRAMRPGP